MCAHGSQGVVANPRLNFKDRLAMSAVFVTSRTCIEGGGLTIGQKWLPREVTRVDGVKFVALHRSEHLMHEFCGKSLRNSDVLDYLRQMRNDLVDAAILKKMYEDEPHLRPQHLPKGAKRLVDPSSLPKLVFLSWPAMKYGNEEVGATEVAMLMELNPFKVCIARM